MDACRRHALVGTRRHGEAVCDVRRVETASRRGHAARLAARRRVAFTQLTLPPEVARGRVSLNIHLSRTGSIWVDPGQTDSHRAAYIRVRSINSYVAGAECPLCVVSTLRAVCSLRVPEVSVSLMAYRTGAAILNLGE